MSKGNFRRACTLAIGLICGTATIGAACTGIRLMAEDGSPIFGRTMEFGSDVLEFSLIAVLKGTAFEGHTREGYNGLKWEDEHSFVTATPSKLLSAAEGVNDAGLQAGAFFFMNFEKAWYQDPDPAQYDKTISGWQLLTFILSQAADVEEAKQLLNDTRVVNSVPEPATEGWEFELIVHYAINDAAGNAIVVEYLEGELHIFDNPLGTITNQPEFSWHQENLAQFTSMPIDQRPPLARDAGEEGPSGLDIGKKADFPGRFTSQARFVRAAIFSQNALPMANSEEGVQRVLNMLNHFDLPLGLKNYRHVDGRTMPQYTQWTSVTDLRDKRIYFRVHGNPNLQMVDLDDIDLSGGEIVTLPVSGEFSATPVQ